VTLSKSAFSSAISAGARTICGLLINKVVAVYLGPSGLVLVGQAQNILNIFGLLAGGSSANGVVTLLAEESDVGSNKKTVFHSALLLAFVSSLILALPLLIYARPIAAVLFYSSDYAFFIRFLAISQFAVASYTLFNAYLNGCGKLGFLAASNALYSLLNLMIVWVGAMRFGVDGAIAALLIGHGLTGLIVFLSLGVRGSNRVVIDWLGLKSRVKQLLGFSSTMLILAVLGPLFYLVTRTYLTSEVGMENAGLWEAMIRLSDGYLIFFTLTLSTYFLPQFARLGLSTEVFSELKKAMFLLCGGLLPLLFGVFVFRLFLIELLYNEEFLPMQELFIPQLAADFFKMFGWVLGFFFIANKMFKQFLVIEFSFTLIQLLLVFYLVDLIGLTGAPWASLINNLLYILVLASIIKRELSVG